jgi:hypothetical protein
MKQANTGFAGALLVFVALLTGGFALWTATGPASGQVDEKPAAPPVIAEATSEVNPVAAAEESPPAVDEVPGQRLEDILSMLATGGEVPEDLRDPAFDYYVDLPLLGHAWVELDSPLLVDLALQFTEGERVLLRSHRAIRAVDLMEVAIRTAAVKVDKDSLARLEKAVPRLENADLTAELAKAQKSVAEGGAETAWMLPVATTSAAEFARYKGVLQDIEAAIVTRDRATLEALQAELKTSIQLPETHRQKLEAKIAGALGELAAADPGISKAAQVLAKLAHSTRSNWPPSGLPQGSGFLVPGGGSSSGGFQVTQTPQSPTQCQAVSTSCPQGSVATQCPAVLTRCPINVTSCPLKVTRCPTWTTICPPESCGSPTQRPNSPTQCQQVQTQCSQAPTQCQQVPTQCQQQPTQCKQQPTTCTQVATECQQVPTRCLQVPTECQQIPTQCAQVPTECQQLATQCVQVPTQCSPAQGKCQRPTLVPYVPTQCPAIQTQCPYSPTYCPQSCGQQQQKQRWIPPTKGKYPPGGSYQQSSEWGQSEYSVTPYPRRYETDPGR